MSQVLSSDQVGQPVVPEGGDLRQGGRTAGGEKNRCQSQGKRSVGHRAVPKPRRELSTNHAYFVFSGTVPVVRPYNTGGYIPAAQFRFLNRQRVGVHWCAERDQDSERSRPAI